MFFRYPILGLVAAGLCACVSPRGGEPPVARNVDLSRYQGVWHEAARLPLVFQNGCVHSVAEYRLLPDGTVSVVNRCRRKNGAQESVRGTASVLDAPNNARLEVRFDTWFGGFIPRSAQGNYWILAVAPDYSFALVGTPDRRNLWILARQLPVPPADFRRLADKARSLGYPVEKLIVDPAQGAVSASSSGPR